MNAETWTQVPGHNGRHEVSSEGRVRTTADVSGDSGVMSLAWILILAVAALMLYKAHVITTVANLVAVALCSVPVGWLCRQAFGEIRYGWEARRYATPAPRPARLAITTRVPLAIEAARPVTPLVIEADVWKMER